MNRATRIPGGRRAACLIAICVGLAGALASAADRIELPVSAAQRKALGIETVTLAASTEAIETTDLPAHVSIVPAQQRVIAAPLAGLVSELRAVPGERVEAGATVFKKCAACHKVGEGAKNGTGPMLNGIVGRAAGTVEGYRYSKPMQDAGAGGMVWDAANLRSYLADPKGFIPKNKMSFAGLKKDEDLDAVIAYLATFGG